MPNRQGIHYFGAGPASIPTQVIESAASALINYEDGGIGIGEISHRSGPATNIIDRTKDKIRQLINVPSTHEIFFAQGGGTAGFSAIPCNLLAEYATRKHKKAQAGYFITGGWSQKAYEEAKRLGVDAYIVADSRDFAENDKKFCTIPPKNTWKFPPTDELAYIYYCDNETVAGIEFPEPPIVPEGVELVADMSSNIMSRQVDVSKFGLIFGGAQKNIGIAGVSFYIIKKSLLCIPNPEELRTLNIPIAPMFLDFAQIVKNNSAYNTIPMLPVYVIEKTMDNLIEKGGLEVQEKESSAKAHDLYESVDGHNKLYKTWVDKSVRSRMNIVFEISDKNLEERFLKDAANQNLVGLKGHRSVGGIRISNYNAVTREDVEILVRFMEEFARENERS